MTPGLFLFDAHVDLALSELAEWDVNMQTGVVSGCEYCAWLVEFHLPGNS